MQLDAGRGDMGGAERGPWEGEVGDGAWWVTQRCGFSQKRTEEPLKSFSRDVILMKGSKELWLLCQDRDGRSKSRDSRHQEESRLKLVTAGMLEAAGEMGRSQRTQYMSTRVVIRTDRLH